MRSTREAHSGPTPSPPRAGRSPTSPTRSPSRTRCGRREITGGTDLYFGSALGIARAGGAYALFSGELAEERAETLGDAGNHSDAMSWTVRSKAVHRDRGTMPRVVVAEKATAQRVGSLIPGRGWKPVDYSVDRLARMSLRSTKVILPPEARSLNLHVWWNEDPLGAQAVGVAGDRAVVMSNDWDSFRMGWGTKAEYSVQAGVTFVDRLVSPTRQSSGLVISRKGSNDTREAVEDSRTLRQHDTVPVTLPPTGRNLYVEAQVHLKLPKATSPRSWTMLAKTSFQTVYLTR